MKRISVFAFYDKDGIVDEYIAYLLKEMQKNVSYQIIVVNGKLSVEGKQLLEQYCDKVILRENQGFDIAGYRQAFLEYYDLIKEYDQLIFYNQSVFGPFYPFEEMFEAMDKRPCDFWGITMFPRSDISPDWAKHIGYLPAHLQSYFLVINSPLLNSPEFKNYFEALCEINTYYDAVGKFEIQFTMHFTNLGFTCAAYVDTSAENMLTDYPLFSSPVNLIENKRCPIAKRKSFLFDRNICTTVYYNNASQALYEYINTHTNYNFNMLLKNLTRTVDLYTLSHSFTPCFTVADAPAHTEKTLMLVYLSSETRLGYIMQKLDNTPKNVHIVVLADSQLLLACFADYETHIAASGYAFMLTNLPSYCSDYSYIAYLTNEVDRLPDDLYDLSVLENCFETLTCVDNNINILANNPMLGVLITFPSYIGKSFYKSYEWANCVDHVAQPPSCNKIILGKQLPPVCNSGMFFAKISSILSADKLYPCFSSAFIDNTVLRAQDVVIPLAAQAGNTLTGFLFKQANLYTDLLNLDSQIDQFKAIAQTSADTRNDLLCHHLMGKLEHYELHHNDMTLKQAFSANLGIKQKLYIIYNLFFPKKKG